jgi:hypothetical protein
MKKKYVLGCVLMVSVITAYVLMENHMRFSSVRLVVASEFQKQRKSVKREAANWRLSHPGQDAPNRDWYILPRTYNSSVSIANGLHTALQIRDEQLRSSSMLKTMSGNTWSFVGPNNIAGRVLAVKYDPSNPSIAYCGAASGGFWKSTDGGSSWFPLTDHFSTLAVSCIAIDKNNPNTIYFGTGEGAYNWDHIYGDGIYKSTDGGLTWKNIMSKVISNLDLAVNSIELHPSDPNIIFAATSYAGNSGGLYRTTDGGGTWQNVLSGPMRKVMLDPNNSSRVVVAQGLYSGSYKNGILISDSTGARFSFRKIASNLPRSDSIGNMSFDFSPSKPGAMIAVMQLATSYASPAESDFLGVYRSTDSGETWERTPASSNKAYKQIFRGQGDYDLHIRFHPTNSNMVFLGGVELWRSLDFGSSWTQISAQNDMLYSAWADQHSCDFNPQNPNMMLVSSDGGVYRAQDNTTTKVPFQEYGKDLGTMQFYGMDFDKKNPNKVAGGTQDRRNNLGLVGDQGWNALNWGGDGGIFVFDHSNPLTFYLESQYGAMGKTTNGGGSFNSCTNGIERQDANHDYLVSWVMPIVMHPTNNKILFAAGNKVYKTLNGASTWVEISNDLTGGAGWSLQIQDLAFCKADPNYMYVCTGANPRVFRAKNALATGGVVWDNVTNNLPRQWFGNIAVDPVDGNIAYVGTMSFDANGGLYKTTDAGATWTYCPGQSKETMLPKVPIGAIVVYPKNTNIVFVGTDVGVYVSYDGAINWAPYGTDLPTVVIDDMKITDNDILYAATHGRGMWMTNVVLSANDANPVAWNASLGQNFPNPVNGSTSIPFQLATRQHARLCVYDVNGRLIRTLLDETRSAGDHSVLFNTSGLENGMYFYTVEAGGKKYSRKLIVLK